MVSSRATVVRCVTKVRYLCKLPEHLSYVLDGAADAEVMGERVLGVPKLQKAGRSQCARRNDERGDQAVAAHGLLDASPDTEGSRLARGSGVARREWLMARTAVCPRAPVVEGVC